MADDLATTLAGIKALIAARDDLAARMDWDVPDRLHEFNAAQDKLAARVPVLLAAIEAALKAADGWKYIHSSKCAQELREAITTALHGEALAGLAGEDGEHER